MTQVSKIVFIHLLNNFSGSPKVLSSVIRALLERYEVDLMTSQSTGFLLGIKGVKYVNSYYKWTNSKFVTLFWFVVSQLAIFFKVLFYKKQNTLFYINTIMPAGAALACKISGKKMIYHIHEDMNQKKSFYPLLKAVYTKCNTKTIFVSRYLQNIATAARASCVIYNCLDNDFITQRDLYFASPKKKEKTTILFVGSLRKYKGVNEFVELAKRLSNYTFEMVLSTTNEEIKQYFNQTSLPNNLTIYPLQNNLHPFYQRANLLLQLSHPNKWIETFGLTILEAMAYGVPAIVPNIGGPTELVDDGINGYTVNPLDVESIKEKILLLINNEIDYQIISDNALQKSRQFNEEIMISKIEDYISK